MNDIVIFGLQFLPRLCVGDDDNGAHGAAVTRGTNVSHPFCS